MSLILFPGESFFRFSLSWKVSFSSPASHCQPNTFTPPPPDIYATHIHPKLPNMEDNDKDQADAVEQALDIDYHVDQALYSHILPKALILLTEEDLDSSMDFEPEYGEGDYKNDEGEEDGGGGGMIFPFLDSAKTTGEGW